MIKDCLTDFVCLWKTNNDLQSTDVITPSVAKDNIIVLILPN